MLKGATILEVAIATLISTVVITIAYNSLEIFSSLSKRFSLTNERNGEIILLDQLLLEDMAKSERILKEENGIRFVFKDKEILYEFFPDEVCRTFSGITDTFYFPLSNSVFLFKEEEQEKENGFVDEIRLEYTEDDRRQLFLYEKAYGPDLFLNR